MSSIPFSLPDINAGFTEIKGLVHLDDEFIVLEVETALLGEFNKDQQVIKVELAALKDIRLDRGLFRDRLCLRPKKPDLLEAVPGKHLGEVQLKIWSIHRSRAEALVAQARARQGT